MLPHIKRFYIKFCELGFLSISIIFLICFFIYYNSSIIEFITKFIQENNSTSILVFFMIFIILSLLGFPTTGTIFLSAILFNFWTAFLVTSIALSITSVLAFFSSEIFVKYFMKKRTPNHIHFKLLEKIITNIKDRIKRNVFSQTIILKVLFPNVLVSYALGFFYKNINLKKFVLSSTIHAFSYSLLLCLFGTIFLQNLKYGIILLLCFFTIKTYLKHKKIKNHLNI